MSDVTADPRYIKVLEDVRSELVVPILRGGHLIGVLDLDSPEPARFDDDDRIGCERLMAIYVASLDPSEPA